MEVGSFFWLLPTPVLNNPTVAEREREADFWPSKQSGFQGIQSLFNTKVTDRIIWELKNEGKGSVFGSEPFFSSIFLDDIVMMELGFSLTPKMRL
ncbi:hypothetical protein SUGI_0060120 [Cryptomeria japonica]|nr:hypothetical protein SUGI_0060120 [Cryptomeria japonica]